MKLVEEVLVMHPQSQEAQEISLALKERISEQEFNELLTSGQSLADRGETEAAVHAFEKALEIFPQHPLALKRLEDAKSTGKKVDVKELITRAHRQLELANLEDAQRSFDEVLQLDPANEGVRTLLHQIDEKLRAKEVKQLLNQGWRAFMLDREYDEVIRIGEAVLRLDPGNKEATSLIQSARKELAGNS